jgi:hypothetical protein
MQKDARALNPPIHRLLAEAPSGVVGVKNLHFTLATPLPK